MVEKLTPADMYDLGFIEEPDPNMTMNELIKGKETGIILIVDKHNVSKDIISIHTDETNIKCPCCNFDNTHFKEDYELEGRCEAGCEFTLYLKQHKGFTLMNYSFGNNLSLTNHKLMMKDKEIEELKETIERLRYNKK